jgi:glucosamine 6-phosphate synthetase-like amidotransferase/phosphosugar isomerase protein
MLNTEIKTIPHLRHRYPTVGDYYEEYGVRKIFVSDMKNEKYEFLVSIHEQIEEILTRLRGIKEEAIKEFDERYEANRPQGDKSEPGSSVHAPYIREHLFATFIEQAIAIELGVNWEDYETTIYNLDEPTSIDN